MRNPLLRSLPFALAATFVSQSALAQTYRYPAIYPFVAEETSEIYSQVKRVTEDPNFIRNFDKIRESGLDKAKTKNKPWTSSYWPMNKGMIADPYEDSFLPYYLDIGWVAWKNNYDGFQKRMEEKLQHVDQLSEEELAKLAPSEKYDLLLGDTSFDLTRRLWEYTYKWGSEKENAFITKLILVGEDSLELARDYVDRGYYSDVEDAFNNSWNLRETLAVERALELVEQGAYTNPENAFMEALDYAEAESANYSLEKKNSRMAAWEGICNGWAVAAGVVPRPRRTVDFTLPNGKTLRFYPADIKGLAALYYVNSLIQDAAVIGEDGLPATQGVVSAGRRCNLKSAATDIWGRPYDHADDPFNTSTHPIRDYRCSGVHPAVWHLGLVNLVGKQGRSFVVEAKVGHAVDNRPMYGYEFEYFNPNNGWRYRKDKDFHKNIVEIDRRDQFRQFRHKDAKYIVGVKNTSIYMDYARPNRKEADSEDNDSEVKKTMYYDLELDEDFNIVGGQWRAYKTGEDPHRFGRSNTTNERPNHNMPDFFWTITKDYKSTGWFSDADLEPWTDKSVVPPRSWLETAKNYHAFEYQMLVEYGNAATCRVWNAQKREYKTVYCEQSYNKPQPLINVLNSLVELSR